MSPAQAVRLRATPLRAALLALVWSVPGIWFAAHVLAHELEHAHRAEHAAPAAEDRLGGLSHDHDHGHHHPETPPAVSAESNKKLDTPPLLTGAVYPDVARATLRRFDKAAHEDASSRARAVSEPRAPPVS